MQWAYGVMDYQISTSASWMSRQQYDITAKAAQAATEPELKQMLQGWLADRFKPALHREQKEMQALVITVAQGGPKFKESVDQGESSLRTQNDVAIGKRASMADHCFPGRVRTLSGIEKKFMEMLVIDRAEKPSEN